jgi:hypothetical protein
VKWWLLALPHYLIVGVFTGGAFAGYAQASDDGGNWWYGSGLIGLLVCFAAIALLFAGRYPRGVYDFIMGMNRWAFRVVAYAALMTDSYPPFRLDMGDEDPPATDTARFTGADPLPVA